MPKHAATDHAQAAGDNLAKSYLRLLREFRRRDLVKFCKDHDRLFAEAKQTGDHIEVTEHYYDLMASVIATYYGDGWHFCPPEFAGQSRSDATHRLYRLVAGQLRLDASQHALDIGCGVGGMMRFMAEHAGANITGITLSDQEVNQANQLATARQLDGLCRVVQGDCRNMPFEDNSFDSAYAVYSLKYYPDLNEVFQQICRVLKPGGRFVAYCLCKTRRYREDQPEHVRLLSQFEYSTGMPSLHTVTGLIESAGNAGFKCVGEEDLSKGDLTWYFYWVQNPLLPWMVSSRTIYALTRIAESVRVLPRGFAKFNDTFLAGTVRHIIRAGRENLLTGSALLTFEKGI